MSASSKVISLIFKGAALEGGYLIGEAIYQILRYFTLGIFIANLEVTRLICVVEE